MSATPGDEDHRPARDAAELEADLEALTRAFEVQGRKLAAAERALADLEAERRRRVVAPFLRLAREVRRTARSVGYRLSRRR